MISKDAKYFISVIVAKYGNNLMFSKSNSLNVINSLAELTRLEGALEVLDITRPYVIPAEKQAAQRNYITGLKNLATYKKQLEEKYNFLFPIKKSMPSKKRKNAK